MGGFKGQRDVLADAIRTPIETLRPLPVEEQWQIVESSYQEILRRASNGDEPDPLTSEWQEPTLGGKPFMERGADLRKVAETPMAAMMFCFEMDLYPPPELVVAVTSAYCVYKHGGGAISLEEALHGKPSQRSGTAAKRQINRVRDISIRFTFAHALQQGMTRKQAAEHVQDTVSGAPDADSILRMLRRFHGYARSKQKAEK